MANNLQAEERFTTVFIFPMGAGNGECSIKVPVSALPGGECYEEKGKRVASFSSTIRRSVLQLCEELREKPTSGQSQATVTERSSVWASVPAASAGAESNRAAEDSTVQSQALGTGRAQASISVPASAGAGSKRAAEDDMATNVSDAMASWPEKSQRSNKRGVVLSALSLSKDVMPEGDHKIMIIVTNRDDDIAMVKTSRNTPLEHAFIAWASHFHVSLWRLRMMYIRERLERVKLSDTPEQLGMSDGDVITAVEDQVGW